MSRIFWRVLRRYFFNKTVGFGHTEEIHAGSFRRNSRKFFRNAKASFSIFASSDGKYLRAKELKALS